MIALDAVKLAAGVGVAVLSQEYVSKRPNR